MSHRWQTSAPNRHDLPARALYCLSLSAIVAEDDEPETLSDKIARIGPIGAD